jgi:DNA repair photolyase
METRNPTLTEVACKTLLQKSRSPWTDYTLNPYAGCAFGCSFCYVPSLRKFRGQEDWQTWGQWVQAKSNASEVLRRELAKIPPDARITIGTATDAYQPVEKRLGITRAILETIAESGHSVSIVTRSPLLLRDIPLLQQMAREGRARVALSLSTFEERARRIFEPHAPAVPGREHLARQLLAADIPLTLFWAPLLPGVSDNAEAVENYLRRAAEIGIRRVMCDLLNYRDTCGKEYAARLRDFYAAEAAATGEKPRGRPALSRPALAREIRNQAAVYRVDIVVGFETE